jgi:CheY-like chemotaxis protein
MAPSHAGHLEMFTRGERSSSRNQGGLGIGLALARRLTEMHGGTLEAESPGPGQGSVFRVRLPILADQPAQPAQHRRAESEVLALKRVLVVDDNQDSAESLGALLGFLGADARTASDGPEALEIFANFDPLLVFLDIGMPQMDGYGGGVFAPASGRRPVPVALTGWDSRTTACEPRRFRPPPRSRPTRGPQTLLAARPGARPRSS